MKEVVFNTWPGAFFHPGGGEVQLLNSKLELEKLNYSISMYDNWKPQSKNIQIYHQFSIEPGTESVMYAYKELGVKIVLSPIMWNLFSADHLRYRPVKNMFEWADVLMTNSKAESIRLSDSFAIPLHKFSETRNSISEEYLNTNVDKDFRKEYSLPDKFILTVANVDNRKNTHRLINACKKQDLPLVIIGAIRETKYYENLKSIFDKAFFLGNITDTMILKSAYQQCYLFALPSLCETPGISALEAMSQGARIVITSVGATQEYFKDYVTYVDPLSEESIVEGFEIELKRERDLEENRNYILENFTWTKTAKDIERGYLKLFK